MSSETWLDKKKLKAMIDREPYKYVHPLLFNNIFPKKLTKYDDEVLNKKIEEYCKKKQYKKNDQEELKNILYSLIPLQEIIDKEILNVYGDAEKQYRKLSIQEQSNFISKYGNIFWESFNKRVEEKVMNAIGLKNVCDNIKQNIIKTLKDILFMGKSKVYEWKNINQLTRIKSPFRSKISEWFGYTKEVWNEIDANSVNDIIEKLKFYKLKDICLSIDDLFKYNEEIDCEFEYISFNNEPKDSLDYYQNVLFYRKNNQYKKALETLDMILESDDMYVYKCYKKFLHQKAILLSTNEIRKFKEALKILKHLHYSMDYAQKEPEIITLMASNYKRLALMDIDGNYKQKLNEQDLENIDLAIEFYKISYKYREELNKKDRFYDLLNILYLIKILTYLQYEDFNKEDFLSKYGKINLKDYTVDSQNWWEVIGLIEYNILLCETTKEKIEFELSKFFDENRNNMNSDFIKITLRQIRMYLSIVKNVDKAKNDCSIELFEFLVEYLESILHFMKNENS